MAKYLKKNHAISDKVPASVEPNLVTSPCIGRCCLNEEDICIGCFRSIDEIIIWSQSKENEKNQILRLCEKRKKL